MGCGGIQQTSSFYSCCKTVCISIAAFVNLALLILRRPSIAMLCLESSIDGLATPGAGLILGSHLERAGKAGDPAGAGRKVSISGAVHTHNADVLVLVWAQLAIARCLASSLSGSWPQMA